MTAGTAATANAPLFPAMLALDRQRVLLVGGGRIAARKLDGLLTAGARVTVVAPEAVDEIVTHPEVRWHERAYRRGEVASYRLAVTATGRPEVDALVHRDADAAGVWVNSADDPAHCSFTLPAVVRRGDVTVAVSTNGRSPALASWLRAQLEDRLGPEIEVLLDLLVEARGRLRAAGRPTEVPGWGEAFDRGLHGLVAAGEIDEARRLLAEHLGLSASAGAER